MAVTTKRAPQATRSNVRTNASTKDGAHVLEHRTAKVVELVASSKRGFDEAIRNALKDASATTRGITGAHVERMTVACEDGRILHYKVNLKVAFGIERTKAP